MARRPDMPCTCRTIDQSPGRARSAAVLELSDRYDAPLLGQYRSRRRSLALAEYDVPASGEVYRRGLLDELDRRARSGTGLVRERRRAHRHDRGFCS